MSSNRRQRLPASNSPISKNTISATSRKSKHLDRDFVTFSKFTIESPSKSRRVKRMKPDRLKTAKIALDVDTNRFKPNNEHDTNLSLLDTKLSSSGVIWLPKKKERYFLDSNPLLAEYLPKKTSNNKLESWLNSSKNSSKASKNSPRQADSNLNNYLKMEYLSPSRYSNNSDKENQKNNSFINKKKTIMSNNPKRNSPKKPVKNREGDSTKKKIRAQIANIDTNRAKIVKTDKRKEIAAPKIKITIKDITNHEIINDDSNNRNKSANLNKERNIAARLEINRNMAASEEKKKINSPKIEISDSKSKNLEPDYQPITKPNNFIINKLVKMTKDL